jgi:hypothetical protein
MAGYNQRLRSLLQRPPLGAQHYRDMDPRARRAAGQFANPNLAYNEDQFERRSNGDISIKTIGSSEAHYSLLVPGSEVTGKSPTAIDSQGASGYTMAATNALAWTIRRPPSFTADSNPSFQMLMWPVGGDLNSATFTVEFWWRQDGEAQSATAWQSEVIKPALTSENLSLLVNVDLLDVPDASYTHLTARVTCDAVSAPLAGVPGVFGASFNYLDQNIHRHQA